MNSSDLLNHRIRIAGDILASMIAVPEVFNDLNNGPLQPENLYESVITSADDLIRTVLATPFQYPKSNDTPPEIPDTFPD